MISIDAFRGSIESGIIPPRLTVNQQALWYAGKGDWHHAHELVQDGHDRESAHIHAYLHRVEGDLSNARYWYSMAGESMPNLGLEEEWLRLAERVLGEK